MAQAGERLLGGGDRADEFVSAGLVVPPGLEFCCGRTDLVVRAQFNVPEKPKQAGPGRSWAVGVSSAAWTLVSRFPPSSVATPVFFRSIETDRADEDVGPPGPRLLPFQRHGVLGIWNKDLVGSLGRWPGPTGQWDVGRCRAQFPQEVSTNPWRSEKRPTPCQGLAAHQAARPLTGCPVRPFASSRVIALRSPRPSLARPRWCLSLQPSGKVRPVAVAAAVGDGKRAAGTTGGGQAGLFLVVRR